MLSEIVRQLEAWSQEQKLVEQAMQNCKVAMKNCAVDDAEAFPERMTGPDILWGYRLEEIKLVLKAISLTFQGDGPGYPYFDTQLQLYALKTDEAGGRDSIGYYRLITTIDGEAVDDYLVMEDNLKWGVGT